MKKYAKKLNSSYEMRFYRRKKNPPIVFPTHTNDEAYAEVFVNLMSPESISEDFFGFSFSRYYPYYENRNQGKFSDIKWVEDEIINEFSNLMYLYFMFSERFPEPMDLKVSRLVIDPNSVRIKGDTDTYNTVDRAKQGLEKSSLFKTTTISSANLDRGKNRVLFEIKLGR